MTLKEQLRVTNERMKQLRKEQFEEGKKILKEMFASLFTEFPMVKGIQWRQYMPCFKCTFQVCDMQVNLELLRGAEQIQRDIDEAMKRNDSDTVFKFKEELSDLEEFEDVYSGDPKQSSIPGLLDTFDEIQTFFEENGEVLKSVFGDHAKVTVEQGKDPEVRDGRQSW
jgi:hypothetical protein